MIGASVLWAGAPAAAVEDRLGDPLPEPTTAWLGTLRLRYGSIGDLAYLPEGRLVSASADTTLLVWELPTGGSNP